MRYFNSFLEWDINFDEPSFVQINFLKKIEETKLTMLKNDIKKIITDSDMSVNKENVLLELENKANLDEAKAVLTDNGLDPGKQKLENFNKFIGKTIKKNFDLFKIGILSGQKDYISCDETGKRLKYRLEKYKYNYKVLKDVKDTNVILISSLLTNGLWDLFDINPYIYSLLNLYLTLHPDKLPNNIADHIYDVKISKFDKLLNDIIIYINILKKKINDNTKWKSVKEDIERKLEEFKKSINIFPSIEDDKNNYVRISSQIEINTLDTLEPAEIQKNIDDYLKSIYKNENGQILLPYEIKQFYYMYSCLKLNKDKKIYMKDKEGSILTVLDTPESVSINVKKVKKVHFLKKGFFLEEYFKLLTRISVTEEQKVYIKYKDIFQNNKHLDVSSVVIDMKKNNSLSTIEENELPI
jgi:hypothetical protein